MKRSFTFLFLGLAAALAGFCVFYLSAASHQRELMHAQNPELLWLKNEFKLSDADYKHVCDLHDAYRPQCEKMCGLIAAKSAELKSLIAQTNSVTPEIARALEETDQLRAECHKGMLAHFFAVSRAMPEEQGKRYLAWVQEQTLVDHGGMLAAQHQTHAHE